MKTVLVITSVASMVDQFLFPNLELFQDMEYEVHVACNFEKGNTCSDERVLELKSKLRDMNILYHQIDFAREVSKVSENIRAYKEVYKLVSDHKYDLIHCHSPIGGVITRLACRNFRKQGMKVFYTAHGFHFYKGAPIKNWLIYYPIEKFCSRFTDMLITINKEDYNLAKEKFSAKETVYIPGVGIDVEKFSSFPFSSDEKVKFRNEIGVPQDTKLLASVGELNANKNHQLVLHAMALLKDKTVHYAIAGIGDNDKNLIRKATELGLSENLHLLGYRTDIARIYKAADICCFPSIREGLPVAVVEGMACGLPLAAAENRGTRDICEQGVNGFLSSPFSPEEFKENLEKLLNDDKLCDSMRKANVERAKYFSVNDVTKQMREIYSC